MGSMGRKYFVSACPAKHEPVGPDRAVPGSVHG